MLKTSLLRSLGQSSRLSSDVVLRINFSAAAAVAASARVQHAVVGTATITQQQNQEPDQQQQEQQQQQAKRVDPFTSAMQNKTEKELMEQMLRQAEEQVLAEDAAEQARVDERGEHGGPRGQEPTRFGDWEKGGRCYDF